jgi:hypothetical protein
LAISRKNPTGPQNLPQSIIISLLLFVFGGSVAYFIQAYRLSKEIPNNNNSNRS